MPRSHLLEVHEGERHEDSGYGTEPFRKQLDQPRIPDGNETLKELQHHCTDHRRAHAHPDAPRVCRRADGTKQKVADELEAARHLRATKIDAGVEGLPRERYKEQERCNPQCLKRDALPINRRIDGPILLAQGYRGAIVFSDRPLGRSRSR